MSPELDKKLCEKWPKIFRNRNKSPRETCLSWGPECGDGWFNIIDMLCEALTYTYSTSVKVGDKYVDVEPPQVIADQIKEKFGHLRFYFHTESDEAFSEFCKTNPDAQKIAERYQNYIDGVVHFAEIMSARTCEITGKEGEMHVSGGGWYRTLNREVAKTDPHCVERNFRPVADLPKE